MGKSWVFMSYRFLENATDVKFGAEGETIGDMFVSAAEALSETIRGDIKILEQEERVFEFEGRDRESLLYNFLEKFLILLEKDDFLVARVKEIEIGDGKLRCVVVGDKAENYKFTNDVKAVIFGEMFIREEEGRFVCQVVLEV